MFISIFNVIQIFHKLWYWLNILLLYQNILVAIVLKIKAGTFQTWLIPKSTEIYWCRSFVNRGKIKIQQFKWVKRQNTNTYKHSSWCMRMSRKVVIFGITSVNYVASSIQFMFRRRKFLRLKTSLTKYIFDNDAHSILSDTCNVTMNFW